MSRTTWASLAACILLGVPTLVAAAAPTPAPEPPKTPFDTEIQASKANMMGEPQLAFTHAAAAAKASLGLPAGSDREMAAATAEWLQGEASTRLRKHQDAEGYLRHAYETVARLAPNSRLQGDILRSRGRGDAAVGRVQQALADFQEAFRIYQRANEPRRQAMVLQDIGSVYADARDYAHVLQYYKQSSEVFSADPTLSLTAHNNRGIALKALGRLPEAVTEFRAALAAADETKSAYLQANILPDLASTEVELHLIDQARADIARGFALAAADSDAKSERPFLLGVLAKVDAAEGDLPRATRRLGEAFAGVDLAKTPMEYRDMHETASKVYARAGDNALALKHLAAFKRLDDQGRELAASTNTALMAAQFDFANQDLKIAKLKAAQLEADAKLRNLILTGLLVAGGLAIAVTTFGFLSMRRSRDRIRAANAQLGVANGALEKALKAKTEFLATTSHEIRTPLNGILGMTQVILADRSLSETVRERLNLVQTSGETMKSLVDDLLDLAKAETGAITVAPEPFDLRRALSDIQVFWSGQAQSKGLELAFDVSEAPLRVVADEARLRQVLFNLMSNALKFTESGVVSLKAFVADDALVFAVHDTGIGIPAKDQDRIFEAFTQVDGSTSRKYGGTGLGLSISRNVAAAMGGDIRVESVEGAGSTFILSLPLILAEEAPAADAATGLAQAAILIVDANPLSQAMIKAVMAPVVRSVVTAASEAIALETLAASPADVVMVDANVLGADSKALLAKLRTATQARIVVTWPSANAETAPVVSPAGADAVILKPAAAADILTVVDALMTASNSPAFADAA